jgi:glucose-6-phosphate dehydrogenase assembly protein OpcA
MTRALQPLVTQPKAADPTSIEKDLAALWRAAGSQAGQPVTRACAMTLLVYTEAEKASDEISELIPRLALQNPCRSVVVTLSRDVPDSEMKAWITAHCHLPSGGDRQVCSEQISIRAGDTAIEYLDKVVLPLTVAGLPVYLWWRPPEFRLSFPLKSILSKTDRLLIDSGRFPEPAKDLHNFVRAFGDFNGSLAVSDLNWLRISRWRELIAQRFDAGEWRRILTSITELRIEYGCKANRSGVCAEALLLIGWFASRLQWQLESKRADTYRFKRPGPYPGEVKVELSSSSGSGGLLSLFLAAKGPPAGQLSLHSDGSGCVETHAEFEGQPAFGRRVRLPQPDEIDLLNEELKFPMRDPVYEGALAVAALMAAQI